MDNITKFLKKLTPKERAVVVMIIESLYKEDVISLDVKKLKGFDDVYRVRKGTLRIIFKKDNSDLKILEISRRSESTYKKF